MLARGAMLQRRIAVSGVRAKLQNAVDLLEPTPSLHSPTSNRHLHTPSTIPPGIYGCGLLPEPEAEHPTARATGRLHPPLHHQYTVTTLSIYGYYRLVSTPSSTPSVSSTHPADGQVARSAAPSAGRPAAAAPVSRGGWRRWISTGRTAGAHSALGPSRATSIA